MSDAAAIAGILFEGAPPRVVLIGADGDGLLDEIAQAMARTDPGMACTVTVQNGIDAASPLDDDSTALLVLDLAADAAPDAATHAHHRLLGMTCRRYPQRVIALIRPAADLAETDLLSFGFRKLAHLEQGALHEYRLSDYKLPPDWLNARFWANPERYAIDEPDDDESEDESDDEE